MDRQQVVEFIFKEVERLNNEEHVVDLAKAGRFEELAAIDCRITQWINNWLYNALEITDDEIPEGNCAALVVWFASCTSNYNEQLLKDPKKFAYRLAAEAGDWGKSIAYIILEEETELCEIDTEEFFSDEYAADYDKEYGEDDDESDDEDVDEDVAEEEAED